MPKALHHRFREGARQKGELFRLQPFSKLGKHRRNVVQTRAGLRVAHQIERGQFRRGQLHIARLRLAILDPR